MFLFLSNNSKKIIVEEEKDAVATAYVRLKFFPQQDEMKNEANLFM